MTEIETVSEKLRQLADELEQSQSEPDYDNPWDWFRPHREIESMLGGSHFDLGIDENGKPLLAYSGEAWVVHPWLMVERLEDQPEYRE